ncbi:SDR family NAD(P)-dependent oxidoreductase [Flavilitoribacter nigricans]|uniref:Short-chain dehydrogenase n=1 Tax=Flavilitoribacter nigricans (strain ATCC 23147 / DSM 23189 / NBRC 102662 / NCIMB 1420 / SS-2) TaxID=1122177 RepID=A0A2D0MY32_FLAN2|nr:SDR family oxidoreductase [Flavilitoribacter nigricans]PHN01090.1 short-chain dehydrogenase [Flavilitoribacter nigricans DSM 23189 = NBRC 102662]
MSQSKIALVTGGSRGLGKNMVLHLAKQGKDVVLTYRSQQEEAEAVVREVEQLGQRAVAFQLDVAEAGSFDAFVSQVQTKLQEVFGTKKLHYLVNNAGIGVYASFPETTEEQLDQLFDIHFKGPYLLTQKILPILANGGSIVNISSGLARFALPGYAAYGAMKGAMETLTRYQAKELGARQIRSNIVAPGAIETDFGGGSVRDNEQVNQFVSSVTALGRAGLPEDIGGVVAFLCSEEGRWINGQRIEVSGGMML